MADKDETKPVDPITVKDFLEIINKAKKELGISDEQISKLKTVRSIKYEGRSWKRKYWYILLPSFLVLVAVLLPALIRTSIQRKSILGKYFVKSFYSYMEYPDDSLTMENCILPTNEIIQDPFRPPVNCNECANVTGVAIVSNLSQDEFIEKYAFSMQPVLIVDAQDGWSAQNTFSFEFFRNIYKEGSEALTKVNKDCQFFPYQTEFTNLGEMLNMSKHRSEGKEKPWYVGWSNCDGKAANILRKHYEFPYFLPKNLDHSKTDWVFMGLPGYGANMHIDYVGALSWQAQVKGTKKWTLQTPPECAGICVKQMDIIVKPGEVIVLDTNKWFHKTLILGKDTSIVIGSEYY